MRGPLELISVFVGSQTVGEFIGRAIYAARLARHDGELVLETRRAQAKIHEQQVRQERLERAQATTVSTLRARQNSLTNLFARQMAVMAELTESRVEALRLVVALQDKLGIDRLRRVAGHGMTISYGEWASAFLTSLGAPVSRNNLVAVVAWEAAEGTLATWNPLATTFTMPGNTTYNSSGVRNYLSKQQGIEASILTLRRPNHGYDAIVAGLRSSAESMETGRAINRSDWCRGCAGGTYVIGFVPAVQQYYERYAN
jgi:hypothetical protein